MDGMRPYVMAFYAPCPVHVLYHYGTTVVAACPGVGCRNVNELAGGMEKSGKAILIKGAASEALPLLVIMGFN